MSQQDVASRYALRSLAELVTPIPPLHHLLNMNQYDVDEYVLPRRRSPWVLVGECRICTLPEASGFTCIITSILQGQSCLTVLFAIQVQEVQLPSCWVGYWHFEG